VCLGVIDAMAVYAILVLLTKDSVVIAAVVALGILAINVVYLKPGLLPAKYLTPGLVFLFVFQIFVVLYCIYIAFTNYGSGHVSTKDDAVNALLIQNQQRVEDSAAYPCRSSRRTAPSSSS
jgi:arabinogalactan oligomer/maltooligosaccharide transport system permease protein